MRNPLRGRGRLLVLTFAFIAFTTDVLAAAKFVSGLVPDWNQPYEYTAASPKGGPGPDPAVGACNQWNAWCAPSSAANLAGHWADVRGVPVADTTAYPGSTVAWTLGPSWHDYQADGFARPQVQMAPGPFPSPVTDIGWYMDTNRGEPLDAGGGIMGGYFLNPPNDVHAGTYLKDIDIGLQNYLNGRYSLSSSIYWRTGTRGVGYYAGVNPSGVPNVAIWPNEANAFAEVKAEIDTNRTLIICFRHWSILKSAYGMGQTGTNSETAFGYTNYTFITYTGSPNTEDETWNQNDDPTALGHAVTCVGYIPAGDAADRGPVLGLGPTDWVIVHDNWVSTPRNAAVPYGSGGQFSAAFVANVTAVPWPTYAKFKKGFVPDWNQPYNYTVQSANGGPGPDPNLHLPLPSLDQWNDWCVPTSAANLAGHWTDYHGVPAADSTAFPGSTMLWPDPSWQDYLADGTELPGVPLGRPPPQFAPGPLPITPTDIGWYMDTNLGVPYDDGSGNLMGGFFFGNAPHPGTFVKDIHIGLRTYLNSLYCPTGATWATGTAGKFFAAGLDPTGGVAQIYAVESNAFGEVMYEINRCHPLILSYKHWNVVAAGVADVSAECTNSEAAFGGSYYVWGSGYAGITNAEDEVWNFYDYSESDHNLGHAVTAVGYIPAGDVLDQGPMLGLGPTDWVIVHDNWVSTPRNVIIPFDFSNNWVANTIAYPDASFLRITSFLVAAGVARITFTGIPGTLHDLQWTSELRTNTTWSTSISNIVFVAGPMRVSNTVAGVTNRFYRIKASAIDP